MLRYAIVDTVAGKIITVVEYESAPSNPPPGFGAAVIAVQNDRAGPDWDWNGSALVPPPPLAVIPVLPGSISRRQFFQQLAVQGIVAQNDALSAARTGVLPSPLQAIVDGLPADQQFGAEMLIGSATEILRNYPLTSVIGEAYGWSSDQIDAFFVSAAAL